MKDKKYKETINNLIIKTKNLIKTHKTKIKIISLIILILIILSTLIAIIIYKDKTTQKYIEYNGENLNTSKYPGYKELIDKLKQNHPNWTFTLFYTKLDFNEVIKNEGHKDGTEFPLNLIPDSSKYPEDWKCEIDKDKRFDNGTWLCASDKAIKYQMDPRNIINEENIFQFKELNYCERSSYNRRHRRNNK